MPKLIAFRMPESVFDELKISLAKEKIGQQHLFSAFSDVFVEFVNSPEKISKRKAEFVKSIINRAKSLQEENKTL